MTLRIAALASGTGSNVIAILDAIEKGGLDARLELVLSNKTDAPVLEKARTRCVPFWARNHKDFASREAFDQAMLEEIARASADTIVLAGYMRMLSPAFIQAFAGHILNIHPSILPNFAGAHGGQDALDYGVRFTGATVHFVDEIMDNGPVIIQAAVPVSGNDTLDSLMPRIHALEHRIYPQALQWLAQNRLAVTGRRVTLRPASRPHIALASHGESALGPWMVSPPLEDF